MGEGLEFIFGTTNEADKREIENRFDYLKANIITINEFNELIDHVTDESRLLRELESRVQNKIKERICTDIFLDNIKILGTYREYPISNAVG